MAHKLTKREAGKNGAPDKYKPGTVRLVSGEGRTTVNLLWQKILNEAPPKLREMLMTYTGLDRACERIAPQQPDGHWGGDDERLRKELRDAEKILVGDSSWFEDYMRRPTLAGPTSPLPTIAAGKAKRDTKGGE